MIHYWLIKQEPASYSWGEFVKDGGTSWTGVRNFQARNNLRKMSKGDLVLYYHSITKPSVVGICKVTGSAYPDPTASDGDWSCIDLIPLKALSVPVTLSAIRADPKFSMIPLLMPITIEEYTRILELGGIE